MFTVTFVLHERADVERTEALRHWRETHGPIVAAVPGVQRYVQQHAVDAPGATPPFLGVASLGFADRGAFEQAAASPEFAAAIADVPNFADETTMPTAFVEEVVVVG